MAFLCRQLQISVQLEGVDFGAGTCFLVSKYTVGFTVDSDAGLPTFSSSWQDSSLVVPGLIFNILTNFLPSEGNSLRKYGKRTNVVTNLNNLDLYILLFELMIVESALNLQFSF